MTQQTTILTDFLAESANGLLIDVRSPEEYRRGHLPGAQNLPLFTDQERSEIGTLYVQNSREEAIERGLELVGPKMIFFIRSVKQMLAERQFAMDAKPPICLYCWRGGMRSNSMGWLLRMYGFSVFVLEGGYKSYRAGLAQLLQASSWKFRMLGGLTGCGKTDLLRQLTLRGKQVLDLEGLAEHRGSAFGHLGQSDQPSCEMFENRIHHCLRNFDPAQPVWVEAESQQIGRVHIPDVLFSKMQTAPLYLYEIPLAYRIRRLCQEYGHFEAEKLEMAFRKIEKRLGAERMRTAIGYVQNGRMDKAAEIALAYYDKSYSKSLSTQQNITIKKLIAETDDPDRNVHYLLSEE